MKCISVLRCPPRYPLEEKRHIAAYSQVEYASGNCFRHMSAHLILCQQINPSNCGPMMHTVLTGYRSRSAPFLPHDSKTQVDALSYVPLLVEN